MPQIPAEVINDIRNKARIEDIISHYIETIKKGNNYVAVCPFHDDHDPSLHISADKQIFKCFVCDTAGDVFSFVQKYENIDYPSAIRKVAELINYNYDFGDVRNTDTFRETPLHKVLSEAVNFCRHELNSEAGMAVKGYLYNRKLSDQMIEKYEMGFNPSNNVLYSFLNRKGYSDRDIIEANLARLTDRGIQDVFYNRLMIPIHDTSGHPIGFTARSLDPNAESKYINTNETPLFHKSDVIFNFHRAAESTRKEKKMILAEGPMDVMAFDRAGLSNAVCSMGTACTKGQLQQIHRLTGNLVLAFDGDRAGQNAIFKTGRLAQNLGFKVSVLNNTTDMDPDEIVNKFGADRLKTMVSDAKTWIEFIFDYYQKVYDLRNYSSKKEFSQKILEEINRLSDSFDRDNYLHQLSSITGFAVSVLSGDMRETRQPQPSEAVQTPVKSKRKMDGVTVAEWIILKQMMSSAQMCEVYKRDLNELRSNEGNALARTIDEYYRRNDTLDIKEFVGSLEDDRLKNLVYEIVDSEVVGDDINEAAFQEAIIKIKISRIEDEIERNKKELRFYTDDNTRARYITKNAALKREMDALKKRQEVQR